MTEAVYGGNLKEKLRPKEFCWAKSGTEEETTTENLHEHNVELATFSESLTNIY